MPLFRTWLTAAALVPATSLVAATSTVTFQNGVSSYTGQVNRLIASNNPDAVVTTNTILTMDGFGLPDSGPSPDVQSLIRFDSMFGSGPGQIPIGATIIDSRLTLTTHNAAASQSGGPYGVAGLLQPFNAATATYNSYATDTQSTPGNIGNRGTWYQEGKATRPVGGIGALAINEKVTVNVTNIARGWADGSMANNGLAVQAGFSGTTDGWTARSGTHVTAADRPALSVTYTTDPVTVARLQQGVNGYTGTSMVKAERDPTFGISGVANGEFIEQDFLDFGADSNNKTAAIRFDDIATAASIPSDAQVLSAYLVITTGETSANARSAGEWQVDALATPFEAPTDESVGTTYEEFGPNGPEGTLLSSAKGMITGSEALFDVTAYIRNVLAGGDNNGFALRSSGTGDGWEIHYTGSSTIEARPELVIAYTTVPEPTAIAGLVVGAAAMLRRSRRA
ncbi:MAG TPA: DNRLRE domain-containing protein [Tepidisphaeraceae bacterium]